MIRTEEDLELGGLRFRRFIFRPDAGEPVRAVAMHFHGQGDYSERYDEILSVFTREGVACVSTDLPGHGRSEGKRGCISGFELIDRIAEANERRCRELCPIDHGSLGILGHSAGGLIALRELLRRPDRYSFSWISSPLLRPGVNQHPVLVKMAPILARLIPNFTVSTGVSDELCFHQEPGGEAASLRESPECFHSRVSAGWGYAMMIAAQNVREGLVSTPPRIPILFTQGAADQVCPARYLQEILEHAALPHLTYKEFPDLLHEPFADTDKENVLAAIGTWLAAVLADLSHPPAQPQTSPSG